MTPQVTTVDEPRWPVQMDTDAGRVFMTASEAEHLMFQLNAAVHELDPNFNESINRILGGEA